MNRVRFGEFEFDPARMELRRRGIRVHLQEMPLRALWIMLQHPGELVSRDDFFARLWPHDDQRILDDNLNTLVRKLRLALKDSAHRPTYIQTVPRQGYRFIAPVRVVDPAAGAAGQASDGTPGAPATLPRNSRRWMTVLAVLIVVVAVAGLAAWLSRPEGPAAAGAAQSYRSVAVLPFEDLTGEPADRYLVEGLADEIMDRLARQGNLRVVSRTSARALGDADRDAQEISALLNAEALVEGSVRRDGERLRISVRLVDGRNGYQLWSRSYEHGPEGLFALQEEVADSIAATLVGAAAPAAGTPAGAVDPVAYDAYLRGRFEWHRRTEHGLRQAVGHFERATALAPDYAPAWAGLGDAYAVLGFYDYLPPAQAFPSAQAAATRALELDPDNVSALATLGYCALYFDWDLAAGERWFRQAVALRPEDSKAHQWYANLLTAAGRFDEAEREMRLAQQLDPLSLIANAALGWVRYHAGRQEAALDQYRLTLELDADFELAYLWSGWSLEALGRYDEALDTLREAQRRSGGSGISQASLARLHALRGEREEALALLEGLAESSQYAPAYEVAKAWMALDEPGRAYEWFERAFEQRSHSLVFLRVDPQLAPERGKPAFEALAERVERAGASD